MHPPARFGPWNKGAPRALGGAALRGSGKVAREPHSPARSRLASAMKGWIGMSSEGARRYAVDWRTQGPRSNDWYFWDSALVRQARPG